MTGWCWIQSESIVIQSEAKNLLSSTFIVIQSESIVIQSEAKNPLTSTFPKNTKSYSNQLLLISSQLGLLFSIKSILYFRDFPFMNFSLSIAEVISENSS